MAGQGRAGKGREVPDGKGHGRAGRIEKAMAGRAGSRRPGQGRRGQGMDLVEPGRVQNDLPANI